MLLSPLHSLLSHWFILSLNVINGRISGTVAYLDGATLKG